MIVQKIPRFESGNILSCEMMDALNQRYSLSNTFDYFGYSDGIIKGFNITASSEYLVVGKGCYIFESEIQYVAEDVKIPYVYGNEVKILVIRTGDKEISRQFEMRHAELKLISEDERLLTDIEICRFCLQQGARLRDSVKNLVDMSTFYDTVCVTYAQWSSVTGQTIAYPVLWQFANELILSKKRTIEDNHIIGLIFASKGESLSNKYIELYLSDRLQRDIKTDTPYAIYSGLRDILKSVQNSDRHTERRPERRPFSERKMIID